MSRQEQTDKTRDGIKQLAKKLTDEGRFKTLREAEARIAQGVERSEKKSQGA